MKRIFSLALIAFSVFFSVSARADEPLKFGLKAGLNVSDFHFSSDVFDKTNQAGCFFGPTVKFTLPVGSEMCIRDSSTANIFFFAGPQVAFNVGGKDFQWTKGSNYALKKSNFSINLGFGVTALKHLQVSANYNVACGKTADVTWKSATQAAGGALGLNKKSSHNNSWQIGVAYFF